MQTKWQKGERKTGEIDLAVMERKEEKGSALYGGKLLLFRRPVNQLYASREVSHHRLIRAIFHSSRTKLFLLFHVLSTTPLLAAYTQSLTPITTETTQMMVPYVYKPQTMVVPTKASTMPHTFPFTNTQRHTFYKTSRFLGWGRFNPVNRSLSTKHLWGTSTRGKVEWPTIQHTFLHTKLVRKGKKRTDSPNVVITLKLFLFLPF